MMQKPLFPIAIAAILAVASLAPSSAEARAQHGFYRAHHGAHRYYAPIYGYAVPYRSPAYRYPFYGRFDSNLNPDRQMVGVFD
jgi:hypothetical protein